MLIILYKSLYGFLYTKYVSFIPKNEHQEEGRNNLINKNINK